MTMQSPKMVAIIPARGGSKGVPRKNLRDINGKPLIAYTIIAALECPEVDLCFVTTEDQEIKEVALSWGAKVIDRPLELASDTALTKDVVLHALTVLKERNLTPEYIVLLQPTSPLRDAKQLSSCIRGFLMSGKNSAISVTEVEHHPYKSFSVQNGELQPLFESEYLSKPRQQLPRVLRQNGAIYIVPSKFFLNHESFFVPPCFAFLMSRERSIDIDTELDLWFASQFLP